jgi:DNA-binding CsgD family transcriptional regulator
VHEPTTPDCLSLVIEREERIARMRAALEAMSPLEQQVLLRRVCAGQPFATVARDLDITVRTVRRLFAGACLALAGGHPAQTRDGAPPNTPPAITTCPREPSPPTLRAAREPAG